MSVRMVDISEKEDVYREAEAEGFIRLKRETIEMIKSGRIEKGDVLNVAKVAGILAAKRTWEIIPLCHNIPLSSINVEMIIENEGIKCKAIVKANYKTGVEMEALTAVSVSLLTIWDMVKKYEKDEGGQYPITEIKEIRVNRKVKTSS
jgi:cyclic pyranopterin phosphate synthase